MFERRLRIFVAVIFVISLVLFCRIFQVQVIAHSYWDAQAVGLLTKPQITETTRGRILDIHGIPLAVDLPCTDACVDYRAIVNPPDPKWVQEIALARLRNRIGADYRNAKADQRRIILSDEIKQTLADITSMWETLAILNPKADAHADRRAVMNALRQGIIQAVQARRQQVASFHLQQDQARESASSRWLRWLARSHDDDSDTDLAVIQEQQEPHVILSALDPEACNLLGKQLEHLPGLQLRASTHRLYPLNTVACHLLGSLSHVSSTDLTQVRRDSSDELRKYQPNDLIGRDGVEALCEPLLRGSRGKIETRVSDKTIVAQQDFVPGSDVQLTIDTDLQKQAQEMLQHVTEMYADEDTHTRKMLTPEGGVSMHAAIVVLDIKTNEVRVMASNPGFDVNDLQGDRYAALATDELNEPLVNRATSDTLEPGSTVKPLVGLGAITDGVIKPDEKIECTGILCLPQVGPDGQTRVLPVAGGGRCWILSENVGLVADEQKREGIKTLPKQFTHGSLSYSEALGRSCDIFFETAAYRLSPPRMDYWFTQFGLGRLTGIGISERPGLRPGLYKGIDKTRLADHCLVGMGQGAVLATPLQIANEAATIARKGIWMRPRLLTADTQAALDSVNPRPDAKDMLDLQLSPEALRQAQIGMVSVVEASYGTGKIEHPGFTLAAKTGTADAAPLWVKTKTADGAIVKQRLMPVHPNEPEGETPWYRSGKKSGFTTVHSWYMGFAPAENPQIAFCVLVEYAGVGGSNSAGPIASNMLEACLRAGYLEPKVIAPSGNRMAFQQ